MAYSDVLHIYGMSRAGYIPQLFSLRLPNADVICELLARTGATALICDPSLRPALARCPVPVSTVFDHLRPAADPSSPLPSMYDFSPNDRAFIFHTSGSTSGSPKLVPCTYRWIDCAISKGMEINKPFSALSQDVSTWMGSMCHIGQTCCEFYQFHHRNIIRLKGCSLTALLFNIVYGSCTIQPTKIAFSSEELKDMVQRCGLNRLAQFATFLSIHIRHSKNDPQLLSMLQNLDEVMYAGIPIGREEEDWALAKGMNVVVRFTRLNHIFIVLMHSLSRTYSAAPSLVLSCATLAVPRQQASSSVHCSAPSTASSQSRKSPSPSRSSINPLPPNYSSSSSFPNLGTAQICRYAPKMGCSTPAISSKRCFLGSTHRGAGTMTGSSRRIACDAILSTYSVLPQVFILVSDIVISVEPSKTTSDCSASISSRSASSLATVVHPLPCSSRLALSPGPKTTRR